MSRFFVEPHMVGDTSIIIDSKTDIQHMTKVLRLREGSKIDISDGQMWEYQCEVVYMDKNEIEAKILDKQKFAREPEVDVTLFQGVPKSGKMDLIVQKTVELGVKSIIPVFMDRTVINDKGSFQRNWKDTIQSEQKLPSSVREALFLL
jgi:16S rRNA (uracil1498-N3)-methyltransferase